MSGAYMYKYGSLGLKKCVTGGVQALNRTLQQELSRTVGAGVIGGVGSDVHRIPHP